MWHIYHFLQIPHGDNSIYKSIFITDDDILSDFIKALNLIGIHEAAVKGQLAFESIVRDLVSSQDDLDKITDWYLKSSRTHESLSILSLRRAVDAMSEQISDLYDLKGLPWQTHKIKPMIDSISIFLSVIMAPVRRAVLSMRCRSSIRMWCWWRAVGCGFRAAVPGAGGHDAARGAAGVRE